MGFNAFDETSESTSPSSFPAKTTPTETTPIEYENQQSDSGSSIRKLTHQDQIDIPRSRSPSRIETPPILSEEYDDHSMVNLLDIDPAHPNKDAIPISNKEVEVHVEDTGPYTETQTATIEVIAETYNLK